MRRKDHAADRLAGFGVFCKRFIRHRLNDFKSFSSRLTILDDFINIGRHIRDFVAVELSSGLQALAGRRFGRGRKFKWFGILDHSVSVNEDLVDSRAGMLWIPKSSMILDIVLVEDNDIRMGVCR